ncbi:MAG TPA: carboxypeptidase regulatory-like domain-containing protein [Thermoanaerobaculia bacterium]
MNGNRKKPRTAAWAWAAAFAALLAVAPASTAQQLSGNIYGYVADEQGGRLPGVTVTLTGVGAAKTQTSDARGEYRFLNLDPGSYTLTYELQGFTKITKPDVQVSVGQNTNTSAALRISSVEATVTVKGEPSLLDTRKVETGAVVDQEQLKSIPTARDPWVILQTVPGVQVDRVNVGGSESGQQSSYVGHGADSAQNVWNVDGVTITDMGALGASPTYYDFDSFEEVHAATGGSDVTSSTPGVQLNLVTKRGSNDVHGSARLFIADGKWQWDNLPQEAIDQGVLGGNRVNEVQDYGVEVGGPVVKDRVWLWGAYGRNQINLFNIVGSADNTTLKDVNGKLNVQLLEGTAFTGTFSDGNKVKFGRNVSLTRPPPASWNQDGPTRIWKGEVSQVFSSSLFMTASYSSVSSGFSLLPQGGTDYNALFIDENGVFQGSYLAYETVRPQHQVNATGSTFFSTGGVGHELKFGFNYRTTDIASNSAWPGNGNFGDLADFSSPVAILTRPAVVKTDLNYYSGYLSDTLTLGNLTVNAGVRYDVQKGRNLGSTTPANPVIPDLEPSITTTDQGSPFTWKNFVPRVGVTYALGQDKKTLAKASYAQYADQLGSATISFVNPGALSALYYRWNDASGDHVITRDELDFSDLVSFYGLDPANPGSAVSPNRLDSNLKAGKTDEIIAGIEREILPDFVVGVSYTYRQYDGAIWPHRTGLTAADYEVAGFLDGTLFDGTTFHQPFYALRPGVAIPPGLTISNRPDWKTTYNGVDLTFQKRLTNKWLVRGNATYQDWKQKGGPGSCYDPTSDRGGNNNLWPGTAIGLPTGSTCAGDDIAALPAGAASGAKGEVFLNSRWQFNVGGLYQLPLGFAIAGNFFGREGYPYIQYVRNDPGDGLGPRDNIIGKLGDHRYDNVYDFDLRLEKVIAIKPLEVTLSADIFNVLNQGTILQRNARVDQATYNQIREIQSPRILRLGARVSF